MHARFRISFDLTLDAFIADARRHSLHRVSPISGPTPRLVALLAYDTKPGTNSSDLLKQVRYGRLP